MRRPRHFLGLTRGALCCRRSAAGCISVCLVLLIVVPAVAETKLPLAAPVRDLSKEQPAPEPEPDTPEAAMDEDDDRPAPTTPGGKLPQYQLGHQQRTLRANVDPNDARLRLILALPAQPVLIEATITIGGESFRLAREKRIQQILEQTERLLNQPEPRKELPKPSEEESTSDSRDTGSDSPDSEEAEEQQPDGEAEDEPEPVNPPTVAQYSLPETLPERVRRYVTATGITPTVKELRWLLTNWVDGPTVLLLNENFQRFRANQRPVFTVLDQDRDGTISAEELQNAVKSFHDCDLNQNDIVDYTELAKASEDPRVRKSGHSGPGRLVFRIPTMAAASSTYRRIAARYTEPAADTAATVPRFDTNADGRFDADELRALDSREPDIRLKISFDLQDVSKSRLELSGVSDEFAASADGDSVEPIGLTLPLGGTEVSFSAVQDGLSDQVSVGAVNDGYPILPVIDPNDDGRFTIRELRSLVDRLKVFDRNADGQLTSDEAQATIRVCFGLGPHVHRELAELRSVNPKPDTTVVPGPEWFTRMDRNSDYDLSRSEFPGNDEQFAALDADNDGLVSSQEALDFEQASKAEEQP